MEANNELPEEQNPQTPPTESETPVDHEAIPPAAPGDDPNATPPPADSKPARRDSRRTWTMAASAEEDTTLMAIVEARQAAGLTRDRNHFLRQCVDFAVNQGFLPGTSFATGLQAPSYLRDAFYTKDK